MPYIFFHKHFPEIAERETRNITLLNQESSLLRPGRYSLLEMYCDERKCDCRRVFFYVVSPMKKDGEPEAVIAYGWESPEFYARWMKDDDPQIIAELQGPILNMCSPQSSSAPEILKLFKDIILQDSAYLERIKRHYAMFRDKIDRKLPLKRRKGMIKKKRKK
jgi:hypothetical protein